MNLVLEDVENIMDGHFREKEIIFIDGIVKIIQ
jgi:small nuclear ribonucleoprotein (snRNP)-like protein